MSTGTVIRVTELTVFDFHPRQLPPWPDDACHRCGGRRDLRPAVGLPGNERHPHDDRDRVILDADDVTWVILCGGCFSCLGTVDCLPLEFQVDGWVA